MIIIIAVLSIFIFVFIFYLFNALHKFSLDNIVKKLKKIDCKINNYNMESELQNNLQLLIEHKSNIRLFKVKLKSQEHVLVIRILLSTFFFIGLNIFGFIFSANFIIISLLGSIIVFYIPLVLMKKTIKRISQTVVTELPDTIDIIASLLKAGLTVDESIKYYSKHYQGEISGLFTMYQIKILEGYQRSESFKIIGNLSFCHEFKTFISIIERSDLIGNPISIALQRLSYSFKNDQRDKIKIKAERIESNLILIIFFFLFLPMILLFMLPILRQAKLLF